MFRRIAERLTNQTTLASRGVEKRGSGTMFGSWEPLLCNGRTVGAIGWLVHVHAGSHEDSAGKLNRHRDGPRTTWTIEHLSSAYENLGEGFSHF